MNKLYKCPYCNHIHTAREWDEYTAKRSHIPLQSILSIAEYAKTNTAWYQCPSCDDHVDSLDVEVVYSVDTNEEASIVLRKTIFS